MIEVLRTWMARLGAAIAVVTGVVMVLVPVADQVSGLPRVGQPRAVARLPLTSTPIIGPTEPAPRVEKQGGQRVFLLLGSDTANPRNIGRTDAIVLAIVTPDPAGVSLVHIPRDLWVSIPGHGEGRINTVAGLGATGGSADDGYTLLKQVIRYNLGVEVDYVVRVDFNGFQQLVDALGGVEITVDCALQDWRLIAPDLDPTQEENWELVTLPAGVHMLTGAEALWYARSRRTSSDFDRGRRQIELLRAVWQRAKDLGLLTQLPVLWDEMTRMVYIDIPLTDAVWLLPLAMSLDSNRIRLYTLQPGVHVQSWRAPNGAAVLLPLQPVLSDLIARAFQPPAGNEWVAAGMAVEIVNASGRPGLDRILADQLAWEGFQTVPLGNLAGETAEQTILYDLSGRVKNSAADFLGAFLGLGPSDIVIMPTARSSADYRIVLGKDFQACRHPVAPPVVPTEVGEASGDG